MENHSTPIDSREWDRIGQKELGLKGSQGLKANQPELDQALLPGKGMSKWVLELVLTPDPPGRLPSLGKDRKQINVLPEATKIEELLVLAGRQPLNQKGQPVNLQGIGYLERSQLLPLPMSIGLLQGKKDQPRGKPHLLAERPLNLSRLKGVSHKDKKEQKSQTQKVMNSKEAKMKNQVAADLEDSMLGI